MTLPTLIWRHRKENLKKCSLQGLEGHPHLRFFAYPTDPLPDLSSYIVLHVEGEPLSPLDADKGLLLLDATWRLSQKMAAKLPQNLPKRSLQIPFATTYPRRQQDCPHPERGLASVEALYLAHLLLQKPLEGILDHYYWKESFLQRIGSTDPFSCMNHEFETNSI